MMFTAHHERLSAPHDATALFTSWHFAPRIDRTVLSSDGQLASMKELRMTNGDVVDADDEQDADAEGDVDGS